jgi:hypothetical protein
MLLRSSSAGVTSSNMTHYADSSAAVDIEKVGGTLQVCAATFTTAGLTTTNSMTHTA